MIVHTISRSCIVQVVNNTIRKFFNSIIVTTCEEALGVEQSCGICIRNCWHDIELLCLISSIPGIDDFIKTIFDVIITKSRITEEKFQKIEKSVTERMMYNSYEDRNVIYRVIVERARQRAREDFDAAMKKARLTHSNTTNQR